MRKFAAVKRSPRNGSRPDGMDSSGPDEEEALKEE
jgi:hypothetical protein